MFLFVSVHLVRGKYPSHFLRQWDLWHFDNDSQNERPGDDPSPPPPTFPEVVCFTHALTIFTLLDIFGAKQLFVVFEFEECGKDLEAFKVRERSTTSHYTSNHHRIS